MSIAELKKQLVRYSHQLHAKGWVANHDGNISARMEADRFLATPTALSKADLAIDDLVIVDGSRRVVSGKHRIFSEIDLHLAAYFSRADINVVLHAHPPAATGFAVAGVALDQPFIAEAVVSIGDKVPLVPYALPGTDEAGEQVARQIGAYNVLLLQNHGVLSVGVDVEQAFLRMELVEHLARIAIHARMLGSTTPIPRVDVEALLKKRAAAGLEPPRYREQPSQPTGAATSADLVALITSEVYRVLAEEKRP